MSGRLQLLLIICSAATFLFVIYNIRKSKMDVKYAVIWISWTIIVAVISIFPRIVDIVSSWMGIYAPTNTLFLAMLFILYILSFYVYINLSMMNQKIRNLVYEVAILKEKLQEDDNE